MNNDPETSLHPQATRRLAEFSSGLQFADLPTDVVEHLKLLILDGLGCCLTGQPRKPLTAEQVRDKFRALTRERVSSDDAESIIRTVAMIDKMTSLDELFDLLRT